MVTHTPVEGGDTKTIRRNAHERPRIATLPLSSSESDRTPMDPSGPHDLVDFHAALHGVNNAINRLCKIKRKYGFDLDDIMIIAACGAINFTGVRQTLPFAQPANISSIAEYVRIPRETVRRKLQNIEGGGFVQRYSGGYLVNNVTEWLTLVGFLTSSSHA